jgi:hypothetical protein
MVAKEDYPVKYIITTMTAPTCMTCRHWTRDRNPWSDEHRVWGDCALWLSSDGRLKLYDGGEYLDDALCVSTRDDFSCADWTDKQPVIGVPKDE